MNFPTSTKTSVWWFAPAVLVIALMGSQAAEATDPAGSPDIVAAPQVQVPIDSRNLVAVPHERDPADARDPQAESALRGNGPRPQDVAKLEQRPPLRARRIRREEERPRLRQEAVAASWHRSGGGSVGLILGIGF